MIQSARQPGLSHILATVLGFDGDEFYLREWPELEGKRFYDVAFRLPLAVPLGVKSRASGRVLMNPPCEYRRAALSVSAPLR